MAPVRQVPAPATSTVGGLPTSRLNKRMAELGLCSRREADDWVEQGWVKVNGVVASMGQQVTAADRIEVDKIAQGFQEQRVTILLNKPIGYVSGQAEDGHTPAVALINPRTHWKDDESRTRSRCRVSGSDLGSTSFAVTSAGGYTPGLLASSGSSNAVAAVLALA